MVVCGVKMWEPLKKFQVSAILAEYFVKFTDVVDSGHMKYFHFAMPSILEKGIRGTFQQLILTLSALFTVLFLCSLSVLIFPLSKQKDAA